MGTRSLTRVFDRGVEILCIYCQFDGYPDAHGNELADFVLSRPFVNGMSGTHKVFNGIGCFAAQLVSHLKGDEGGGIYIKAPGSTDCGEEYVYEVHGGLDDDMRPGPIRITCTSTYSNPEKFDGAPDAFKAWCNKTDEAEAA